MRCLQYDKMVDKESGQLLVVGFLSLWMLFVDVVCGVSSGMLTALQDCGLGKCSVFPCGFPSASG